MKALSIPDEIILNRKVKLILTLFCLSGILVTLSVFIPAVQVYFSPFIEKVMINHQAAYNNWISIIFITGLTFFLIIFFTVIKKTINKYELLIFLFLIIQLLDRQSFISGTHANSSYLLSYRYGFSSRMFIGTIVDLFSGGSFISNIFVALFNFYGSLWLSFFVSKIIGYVVLTTDEKLPVLIFVVLYLSSSVSPSAYFTQNNAAWIEKYIFMYVLIILSIIDRKKWCWFIPVLCFMSLATHLVVIFFYIPLVFIILLYKYIIEPNTNGGAKFLLLFTIVVIILSFIYFVVFSKSTLIFQNVNEFAVFLESKTDMGNYSSALHAEYFWSIHDHFKKTMHYYRTDGGLLKFSGGIIQNLPLFLFFILFWRSCIKTEQKKPMKLVFLFSMFTPLFSIPAFLLFVDFGRWIIMLITVQFMLVFYFLYKREDSVIITANKFVAIVYKEYFAAIVFVLLSIYFGPIRQQGVSANFGKLLQIILMVMKQILRAGG